MRVIAGQYGSRRLQAVPGLNTRPTTDKIKEGMFNLMGGFFDGGTCLDFYGGSGALAIEAVSRGMDQAIITEKYRPAIETIQKNIEMTKEKEKFILLSGNNRSGLTQLKLKNANLMFDLVLLDPPYKGQQIIEDIQWLDDNHLLNKSSWVMCETDNETNLPDEFSSWIKIKYKEYGLTRLHLYEKGEEE